jgi:hypothetical protein
VYYQPMGVCRKHVYGQAAQECILFTPVVFVYFMFSLYVKSHK